MLQNRSVATVIILSLVTCGIYALYWTYVTINALDQEGQSSNMPAIVQFLLLFFYVGYILFAINANNNLNAIRAKKGYPAKDQMVLYLILSVVCPIALVALVQNDINELA
ncbi:MAG: DUF4234 domain-containing protein [Lachnospiraceae bacterium]|nr:DUF4234 domain-containing protein [Lachnospiraceae bacterium]